MALLTQRSPKPYRPREPQATSYLMSRVRSSDTRIEVRLRSALHRAGVRFRKNAKEISGRPDIAFSGAKIAVFVDGDFWHGRILQEKGSEALERSLKTKNKKFWISKIKRNVDRDRFVTQALQKEGWYVARFWETDLKKDLTKGVEEISLLIARRSGNEI